VLPSNGHKFVLFYSDELFTHEKLIKAGAARFALTDYCLFVTCLDAAKASNLRIAIAELEEVPNTRDTSVELALRLKQTYTILNTDSRYVVLQVTNRVRSLSTVGCMSATRKPTTTTKQSSSM
jgi:hypothetical protein